MSILAIEPVGFVLPHPTGSTMSLRKTHMVGKAILTRRVQMVEDRSDSQIGRLGCEGEPSGYNVMVSVFSHPLIGVPISLILFFAFVFGVLSLYEGKEELGIAIFVIAAVALAFILVLWKKMRSV